jgi:cobalamin biosynthesis protein CobT
VSDIINSCLIVCQIDACDSTAQNTVSIEVTKFSENEVVVEISPEKTEKKENGAENEEADDDKDDESESNSGESTGDVASSRHCASTSVDTEEDDEPFSQFVHATPHKHRSFSESSETELVSTLLSMMKYVNFFASLFPYSLFSSLFHFICFSCCCVSKCEKVLFYFFI